MRLLFDIGHPAHVHLFRNAIRTLDSNGHEITITIREKDLTAQLLDQYGFPYSVASAARRSTLGLLFELVEHDWNVLRAAVRNSSELLLGTSAAISHVARLTGGHSVFFGEDDADVVRLQTLLTHPLAHTIVTPRCLRQHFGRRHVRYNSYQELAYLHPNVFTANPEVLPQLGIQPGEPYFVLRFVSLHAAHDRGERGLSLDMRRTLVETLSKRGKVFITGEATLPEEFDRYRIPISPQYMHDALAFATMLISDSQTMTAEAAVLGTPAIRCNSFVGRISYLEELEHEYGLTCGFLPQEEDQMFRTVVELLARDDLRAEWQRKRERMLDEKTDLTPWMVDFIERYPESFHEYRKQTASERTR